MAGFEDIKNLVAGDVVQNVWNSSIWGKIGFWVQVIVVVGGLSVAAAWVWKNYLPYNKKVFIYRRLGNGAFEVKIDRAREDTDSQGKRKLLLLKTKKGRRKCSLPIPPSKFRFKLGRADAYNVFMDDNGEMHPIEANEEETRVEFREHIEQFRGVSLPDVDVGHIFLKVRPQERDAWARYEDKQLLDKFKKKEAWEKWLPSAIFLGTLFAVVLIWFFLSKDMAMGLSEVAGAFRQIASSCTALG